MKKISMSISILVIFLLVLTTVSALPPGEPLVNITPYNPGTVDDITCQIVQGTTDPDGDPFNYTLQWYRRNATTTTWTTPWELVLEQTDLSLGDTNTIANVDTLPQQYWKCSVFADDGSEQGIPHSDVVIVDGIQTDRLGGVNQWFVPFGEYKQNLTELGNDTYFNPSGPYFDLVNRPIYAVNPSNNYDAGPGRIVGLNNTPFRTIVQTECIFGECGNTNDTQYDPSIIAAQLNETPGAGLWSLVLNPQRVGQAYPDNIFSAPGIYTFAPYNFDTDLFNYPTVSCFGNVRAILGLNATCDVTGVINPIKNATLLSWNVSTTACSESYNLEIPCRSYNVEVLPYHVNYTRDCAIMNASNFLENHWNAKYNGTVWESARRVFDADTTTFANNIIGTAPALAEGDCVELLDYTISQPGLLPSNYNPIANDTFQNIFNIWNQDPGLAICMNSSTLQFNYYACTPQQDDIGPCEFEIDCGYLGCCYYDGACAGNATAPTSPDADLENVTEMCVWSGSIGTWFEPEEQGVYNKCFGNETIAGSEFVSCSEDGIYYDLNYTYNQSYETYLYCIYQNDTKQYEWQSHPLVTDLAQIDLYPTAFVEGCYDAHDSNCNAFKQFEFNGTHIDFTRYHDNYVIGATSQYYDVENNTDLFDPVCFGGVTFEIRDAQTNQIVNDTTTTIELNIQGGQLDQLFRTNTTDTGYATWSTATLPATSYTVEAYAEGYGSDIEFFRIDPATTQTVVLYLQRSFCNSDCTTTNEPTLCEENCHNQNGCAFYNTSWATVLDGVSKGAQIEYEFGAANYTINACEGDPTETSLLPGIYGQIRDIECEEGKHISTTEILTNYQAEGAKIVVVTCEDD